MRKLLRRIREWYIRRCEKYLEKIPRNEKEYLVVFDSLIGTGLKTGRHEQVVTMKYESAREKYVDQINVFYDHLLNHFILCGGYYQRKDDFIITEIALLEGAHEDLLDHIAFHLEFDAPHRNEKLCELLRDRAADILIDGRPEIH